jgi:DNA-binding MarR family transcriptional regulator
VLGVSEPDSVDRLVAGWTEELGELDSVREQVVVRIIRIARHLGAEGEHGAGRDGLALWQCKTLLALRRSGPPYETSPSELAEFLGLTRGAVTARLQWLEDLGLIEREHDRCDRRRVRVRLTADGHRAIETVVSDVNAREAALFAGLTKREQRLLADLLRKVLRTSETPEGP